MTLSCRCSSLNNTYIFSRISLTTTINFSRKKWVRMLWNHRMNKEILNYSNGVYAHNLKHLKGIEVLNYNIVRDLYLCFWFGRGGLVLLIFADNRNRKLRDWVAVLASQCIVSLCYTMCFTCFSLHDFIALYIVLN